MILVDIDIVAGKTGKHLPYMHVTIKRMLGKFLYTVKGGDFSDMGVIVDKGQSTTEIVRDVLFFIAKKESNESA